MNYIKLFVLGVLVMHGIGHSTGFFTAWTKIPMGFSNLPWLFSQSVRMDSLIGKLFGLVWLAVMACFLISAYGLFTGQVYWLNFAVAASIGSLIVILPWARTVPAGALYGGTLANIAILVAAFGPWKTAFLNLLH